MVFAGFMFPVFADDKNGNKNMRQFGVAHTI